MTHRHATHQRSARWPVACTRALLCSAITSVLLGWGSLAMAAAATGADAAPATGADASAGGYADFDRSLLSGAGQNTSDLSRFEHGNPVLPGNYNADVYINNAWVGRSDIRFVATDAKSNAAACVDRKLLEQLGLHPADLSEEQKAQLADPNACVRFDSLIPGATLTFDMSQLRLDASVPQIYMSRYARGYVSPEYWDAGVPAALLNYNFNAYHSSSSGVSQSTAYLGVNAGLNVGAWHLREQGTMLWASGIAGTPAHTQWQNIQTYLQRDIASMRALLTIGDSYTDGAVFDSYGIRGVQLGTDDRMLPQSMQGYAPLVRGVAQTNARISVRQNGVEIYQTTVAPGPFSINDLYPTGYGGNLDVTVTEADGRVNTFVVPYASVAQLLRPGITRFDIAAGELRANSINSHPAVAQAAIQHGFSNLLTGYAGIAASQGYGAVLVGGAVDTRYGALALDITQANAHIPGYSTQSGQSYRVTYSKIIPSTQTTFSVAAYRYSTGGFLTLTQTALARQYARDGLDAAGALAAQNVPTIDGVPVQSVLTPAQQAALSGSAFTTNPIVSATGVLRQRSNFTLSLNQVLGKSGGSVYANVSASDYWNQSRNQTQFQLGYNNHFRQLSYNLSATRSATPTGRYDNQYFLSFSIPLGSGAHAPNLALNLTHDEAGTSQEQAMLNGTLGSDNQFNYGASATHTSGSNNGSSSEGNSGSVYGGYRSPYAVVNASYGNGSNYSQASVSASGSVVAHPGGVTFGQPIGDTVGIVYVPGAAGATVNGGAGVRIDRFGYAVLPFLAPYTINSVEIDPKGLPLDVQLDATSNQVAPYAGAVVMVKFKTQTGRSVIFRARMADGSAPPFGAEVVNQKGVSLGVVGQGGLILARGVEQAGVLMARWQDDNGDDRACSFSYDLPAKTKAKSTEQKYEQFNVTCKADIAPVAQVAKAAP
ncbi:fimbria/pilus outer membrane usher protein [Dyella telluris]|uniref:Fimbrial biogenesis outer membrane usher protein n=1 Tax=Dyella telluris TaxID=2763498 RepID=A0A7G8Q8E2_9GAMM|nr:fimbria/pilus outer membrane usher protein [Dyella telluris]QNK03050.1 fimbrial biogenesis outer membrane usher protein [Dyella telluris]